MQFSFHAPTQIIFGSGTANDIPARAATLGTRVCLVTGSNPGRLTWLEYGLAQEGLSPLVVSVGQEPDTDYIAQAATQVREHGCDVVIAVGGGSVLDAGKALAALITNTGELFDYLEVVGQGQALSQQPVPCIAAPTTAGTGSEATANAVLLATEQGVKVSMRHVSMLPDLAVVDPVLAMGMPRDVTASTGLDALTQLLEAHVSHKANAMTSALCRDGLARAARSLKTACEDGGDMAAREDMALAALFSGLALANAKLGAVHGFAAPIGGRFKAPHGAVCAALLPEVMEANIKALREQTPEHQSLSAYWEVARILTGDAGARVEDGVAWVRSLCKDLDIPGLAAFGVTSEDFPKLVNKASLASSMAGNPIQLSREEMLGILQGAL